MGKKKNAPAEIEKVTITMSRPVAEAVAKACEMYLRLHMGQFEDLTDELCMAKFYAALENDSFANEEERDEIFHISIDRRNIMQEEVDKLYKRYVLSAPLDYCMRIPYRAEQVWLAIRHALAWHDNPKGNYTVQYDKPLNRSDQPQPMVQLYEVPTEGKATKKASAAVAAHAPVLLDSDKVKPIAKVDGSNPLSVTGLYGITADSAEAGEEVPVYLTGEFFADALVLPEGVKAADIEVALRNLGIFLK